ncbi:MULTISPECIES: hypothetical protein [unclassified Nonomuraea]|uniref:hypothetical protein n=1 Tax=unclassified Nonomuraea TaxID=2593643 RepID=UPI0033F3F9C1
MSKITIDDIAPAGAELHEGDLRLVNGAQKPELCTAVLDLEVGTCSMDPDICGN